MACDFGDPDFLYCRAPAQTARTALTASADNFTRALAPDME
jgi:hypothetical protein